MKKLLFSLLMVPALAVAEDVPLGMTFTSASNNAQQTASVLYGRQLGSNTLRQIAVDASGNLAVSGATAATSIGVTSTPSLNPPASGSVSVLATSYTAQVINLTSTAGAAVPCVICLSSNGGPAAGFRVDFGTDATAPVALTSTGVGAYIAASTTAQCWGKFAPGTHAYIAGVAASSQVIYSVQKVQ